MNITFNITTEEEFCALEIALYINKKQAFEEWLYKNHSSNTKINRKIMQAYTSVYNQLYKYNNPHIIKPRIKGVNKTIKVKEVK